MRLAQWPVQVQNFTEINNFTNCRPNPEDRINRKPEDRKMIIGPKCKKMQD